MKKSFILTLIFLLVVSGLSSVVSADEKSKKQNPYVVENPQKVEEKQKNKVDKKIREEQNKEFQTKIKEVQVIHKRVVSKQKILKGKVQTYKKALHELQEDEDKENRVQQLKELLPELKKLTNIMESSKRDLVVVQGKEKKAKQSLSEKDSSKREHVIPVIDEMKAELVKLEKGLDEAIVKVDELLHSLSK